MTGQLGLIVVSYVRWSRLIAVYGVGSGRERGLLHADTAVECSRNISGAGMSAGAVGMFPLPDHADGPNLR